jgi:hypothetical protein
LMGQHRQLAESSLRRKIAGLREAITGALESLVERRRRGPEGLLRIDIGAARRLLDEGDKAIRRVRTRYQDWSLDRQAFFESVLAAVAEAVVEPDGRKAPSEEGPASRAIGDELGRRGRTAYELASRLQKTLSDCLEVLQQTFPSANSDLGAVKDEQVSALPIPDLGSLRTVHLPGRPMWAALVRWLAARTVYKRLVSQAGTDICKIVEFYDRRLQSWVKGETERIIGRYEAQVEALRERVRQLENPDGDTESAPDLAELIADLDSLRSESTETAAAVARDGPADGGGL